MTDANAFEDQPTVVLGPEAGMAEAAASAPPKMSTKPPNTPEQDGSIFVGHLKQAGLVSEMSEPLLQVYLESVGVTANQDARRLSILELYYEGSETRQLQDCFVVHHDNKGSIAKEVVAQLAINFTEVGAVSLERIGSDDGPLVLRAGDHLSAVTDPEEELDLDTHEVDLNDLVQEGHVDDIAVQGIVAAFNVLLSKFDVRKRYLMLCGDGEREIFIATGVAEAISLCTGGYLSEGATERMLEFGSW